jgi:shikimate dehydrogenase
VLDESVRTWGAVNTVRFEGQGSDGSWRPLAKFEDLPDKVRSNGFNTDAAAISRSLQEDLGVKLQGATVLLLGAGGAGRTAALKLASEGVSRLYLVNRTHSKAETVAAEVRKRFGSVRIALGYPPEKVDLLLNATSLGLKTNDALPFDEEEFPLRSAAAVYDMIYRPAQTPLLAAARSAGCRTANGIGMLLYQGAKALEIWSGQAAPLSEMRSALEKNVYAQS